jgi:DNA-binding MarR family transcriptional regulator
MSRGLVPSSRVHQVMRATSNRKAGGVVATSATRKDSGSKVVTLPGGVTATAVYDLRILRALRRIMRSVEQYSRQLSISSHITTPQLICLMEIAASGPVTATGLSRAVHLSPSTVVGIIDRLEEKGWVARERNKTDRRVVHVAATERGRKLLEQAPSPLQQTLATALNGLPELEQATIALSLERIVDLMEAQGIDASPILTTGPIIPDGG